MIISLHIVSGRFCTLMAQLSSCDINHIIHKVPDIYHLKFDRKGFSIAALDNKLQETEAHSHSHPRSLHTARHIMDVHEESVLTFHLLPSHMGGRGDSG